MADKKAVWLVALTLTALATPVANAATTIYEAEHAARTSGVVESNHDGYTGTGFVNYDNVIGSSVEFTAYTAHTAAHDLVFRYANGTTADRPLEITVDGTPATVSFESTGAWTTWATRTLSLELPQGTHTIRATATTAEGGPNLDSLTVVNSINAPSPRDWSTAVVDSAIATRPATSLGLGYTDTLFLHSVYLVHQRTGRYLDYLKAWGDARVRADGSTGNPYNDLDSMLAGNIFLDLAQATGEQRYRLAAQRIRDRIATYPRTSDGGLIHNVALTGQLWADGVFMAQPFLARAGDVDTATHQLSLYYQHLKNPEGLLRHAYNERTGQSPEVWCRAVGWFGMATVDVLRLVPRDHPDRATLVEIVRHLADGYRRFQDASGLWFQLPLKPQVSGNWLETSCSSMYAYTISRAVKQHVLSPSYLPVARRGYRGVLGNVSIGSDGRTAITDISVGTSVGDEAYYLRRPRAVNDFHGLGAFLLMNEEMV
ncbi:glycoside hydrolase family 88 protein [Lentzea aerocolonigenes]|uniref:glycoside hydrolase family 88 protein n=1 Tax=Lentzea aerocolonigenes TaxID=68170 RepID=UPI0018C88A39|nr:glycoside hydrolase family 88 protein [Lentzea aerocolonigenes]